MTIVFLSKLITEIFDTSNNQKIGMKPTGIWFSPATENHSE